MRLGGRNLSTRNTLILITNDHYRGRQWLRLPYCANLKDSRLPPQRSCTGCPTIPACCRARAVSGKTSTLPRSNTLQGRRLRAASFLCEQGGPDHRTKSEPSSDRIGRLI